MPYEKKKPMKPTLKSKIYFETERDQDFRPLSRPKEIFGGLRLAIDSTIIHSTTLLQKIGRSNVVWPKISNIDELRTVCAGHREIENSIEFNLRYRGSLIHAFIVPPSAGMLFKHLIEQVCPSAKLVVYSESEFCSAWSLPFTDLIDGVFVPHPQKSSPEKRLQEYIWRLSKTVEKLLHKKVESSVRADLSNPCVDEAESTPTDIFGNQNPTAHPTPWKKKPFAVAVANTNGTATAQKIIQAAKQKVYANPSVAVATPTFAEAMEATVATTKKTTEMYWTPPPPAKAQPIAVKAQADQPQPAGKAAEAFLNYGETAGVTKKEVESLIFGEVYFGQDAGHGPQPVPTGTFATNWAKPWEPEMAETPDDVKKDETQAVYTAMQKTKEQDIEKPVDPSYYNDVKLKADAAFIYITPPGGELHYIHKKKDLQEAYKNWSANWSALHEATKETTV